MDDRYCLRALPNEDVFLYSKRIDNSRVVRERRTTARRRMVRDRHGMRLLPLLFMGSLTPRVANIFAGYQLESLKQEQQRLLDEQRELDIVTKPGCRGRKISRLLAKRRELSALRRRDRLYTWIRRATASWR